MSFRAGNVGVWCEKVSARFYRGFDASRSQIGVLKKGVKELSRGAVSVSCGDSLKARARDGHAKKLSYAP